MFLNEFDTKLRKVRNKATGSELIILNASYIYADMATRIC